MKTPQKNRGGSSPYVPFVKLDYRNYISAPQLVLGWLFTILLFGLLGLALLYIFFISRGELATIQESISIASPLIRTIFYALGCSIFQVLGGLCIALAIKNLKSSTLKKVLIGGTIAIYSLQPAVVHEIWTNTLFFSSNDLFGLTIASIWQFIPFPTLFFLVILNNDYLWQRTLTNTEAKRWASFKQVYGAPILRLATGLFILRFLWMVTKFDLPWAFQKGLPNDKQLITVRIGKATDVAGFKTWVMLLLIVVIMVFVLLYVIRFWNERRSEDNRNNTHHPSKDFGSGYGIGQVINSETSVGVISFFLLVIYFSPLLLFIFHNLGYLSTISIADDLLFSLITTFLIGGSAALFAGLAGFYFSYASRRGQGRLRNIWELSPLFVYAVPLIVLSIAAKSACTGFVKLLSQSNFLVIIGDFWGIETVRFFLDFVPQATTSFVCYVLFTIPFVYIVLSSMVEDETQLSIDNLAICDGARPGMRSQARIAFRKSSGVIYAGFFAFLIIWQDLSIPIRLSNTEYLWFSHELVEAGANEASSYSSFLMLATTVSLFLGIIHAVVFSDKALSMKK